MNTATNTEGAVPQLIYCKYWERKDKFLFYEDTCREWTIFAVIDGSFQFELCGEKGNAAFGDLIVCPTDTVLRRVIITPLTFFAIRVRWHVSGRQTEGPGESTGFVGKISIRNTKRLAGNYVLMKQAEVLDEARKLWLRGHYMQDIWLLYGEERGHWPWPTERHEEGKQLEPMMVEASSLIRKRAFETFDLKEIAGHLGISPVRLSQKFKSSFGQTPIQYLTSIRMEKAKQLLLETTMTLEQISECLGYQNGYYLNHLFMKHMGVSPSAYRKTHRI